MGGAAFPCRLLGVTVKCLDAFKGGVEGSKHPVTGTILLSLYPTYPFEITLSMKNYIGCGIVIHLDIFNRMRCQKRKDKMLMIEKLTVTGAIWIEDQ